MPEVDPKILELIPERFRNFRFDGFDVLTLDKDADLSSDSDLVWIYRTACIRLGTYPRKSDADA